MAYGGKQIGTVTLIERPYWELLSDMPDSDLVREGGMVGSVTEFIDKYFDGDGNQQVAVVRFKFEPLTT